MKRKSSELKEGISVVSNFKTASEKISFYAWFDSKLHENPKLRAWQREQLMVFVKSHGLSENEEKEKYEKAFLKF